jgi:hypothetical protein
MADLRLPNSSVSRDSNNSNSSTQSRFILPKLNLAGPSSSIVPKGFPGGLSYDTLMKIPFYSDGSGWRPLMTGMSMTVTYRPGYIGPKIDNVYTSFAEVSAALNMASGCKFLCIDPQDVLPGPVIIPPGEWNMKDVKWVTPLDYLRWNVFPGGIVLLQIQDGATFPGLSYISGPFNIEYQGTTGPAITIPDGGGGILLLELGIRLYCTGGREFVRVGPNTAYEVVVNFGCGILRGAIGGNAPVVFCEDTSQFILLFAGCQCIFEDDTLASDPTALVIVIKDCVNIQASIPLVQTGVTGTLLFNDEYANVPMIKRTNIAPTVNDDSSLAYKTGDLWIDSTGPSAYIAVDVTVGAAVWTLI